MNPGVAVVSGASRGIGAACAVALAETGFDVAIGYVRDEDGARKTLADVEAAGAHGFIHRVDVSDENQVADFVAAAEAHGEIAAAVLNAGITRDGLALRMTSADWTDVVHTNLDGAFFTARAVLRGMLKRRRGSIVAVSSIVGLGGNAGQANYAAAKAGVIGMAKSLAREVGGRGVRVNTVAPGYIATDMTAALTEDQRSALLSQTPLARLGVPADVASAVAFLCSPAASFITGAVLPIDGGLSM